MLKGSVSHVALSACVSPPGAVLRPPANSRRKEEQSRAECSSTYISDILGRNDVEKEIRSLAKDDESTITNEREI